MTNYLYMILIAAVVILIAKFLLKLDVKRIIAEYAKSYITICIKSLMSLRKK